ncbi:MAG: type I-B CRISPR-associated protein Cas5 [Thermodesulfobium narugense]|nr:MAG: type I-B CRISPR-associated protein Cas5 [Thermodesulfobium narugense]
MDRLIIFDIEGPFAHFRKGYTTTSPVTYDFPPRTVLIGMLGALLGYDEDTYIESFSLEKCKIGVGILKDNSIRSGYKIKLKENWREGPGGKAEMKNVSQVGLEVLRYPSYRIYLHHSDQNTFDAIKDCLINGESVFSPYLGLKEFACRLKYVDTYPFERHSKNNFIKITSVIPENPDNPYSVDDIDDSKMQDYILRRDIVPNEIYEGRKFKRIAVLYEINGKPLWLKPKKDIVVIPTLNERIMFLE